MIDPYEDEYDGEEEPDGQLLLEIIRKEEDRDLRELVKRFRDQCRQHMSTASKPEMGWAEQYDRSVIDYLKTPYKVALLVSQQHQTGLRFDYSVVGQVHVSSKPTCIFFKIESEPEPLLRPSQFDSAIYSTCLVRGASDLPRHVAKVAFYFERQALILCGQNRLKELKHLMQVNLMKLRHYLIDSRCLNEGLLLKPTLVAQPPSVAEDDEDQVEQLERLAHQWIYVVTYNLELRDYFAASGSKNGHPTIQDEINSLVQRYEILKKLGGKLTKVDYQRVLATLKKANSAVGDELENLIFHLQEQVHQTKLAVRYLTCLRRSVENIEKVKIVAEMIRGHNVPPLNDLPAIYQDACNRVIIIVRHVPEYENRQREAAARLMFTTGNEVVAKISEHALEMAVDHCFLKGKPHQCADDLEKVCRRCIDRCVATYNQTMKWQEMEMDGEIVLANLRSLDLRFEHLIDICQSLEQLGRYGDGIKTVTFSTERERDIGRSLTAAQDTFVAMAINLVTHHRDDIFDIQHPDKWYKSYNKFQSETRALEIRLVHDLEDAVSRCRTLWSIYEVMMAFKHLYKRPLFTAVINSTANQLLKKASREAKVACGISSASDPWSTPISATLTTHSSRLAAYAQRARGYVDKIAKLVQMTSWAGSPCYREKATLRCQQAHRLLGEAIKKEFADWLDKLHMELQFNTNTALHKIAIRRHFQRPDWIQSNLDGVVFQVIQAAENWDRLLMELPPQVSGLWLERNELRNVHGSVCAMCYYYNYIVQELDRQDQDLKRQALAKLEKAVAPCLNSTTWKQLIMVKRIVTAVYFAMEEVIMELAQGPPKNEESGEQQH